VDLAWFRRFKQNNAEIKFETHKEAPTASLIKGKPQATASFSSPNIHPCPHVSTEELSQASDTQ